MHSQKQPCRLSNQGLCREVSFSPLVHLPNIPDPLTQNHRHAPFIYDAWNNPALLSHISKIAGVDLIPNMNLEIGHVNISVKSSAQAASERAEIERERKNYDQDEGIAGCPWEDDKPVVGWHTDSYPFVCVTMLSDCEGMVGGETALRTGFGDVLKVRGPEMVCSLPC